MPDQYAKENRMTQDERLHYLVEEFKKDSSAV